MSESISFTIIVLGLFFGLGCYMLTLWVFTCDDGKMSSVWTALPAVCTEMIEFSIFKVRQVDFWPSVWVMVFIMTFWEMKREVNCFTHCLHFPLHFCGRIVLAYNYARPAGSVLQPLCSSHPGY